MNLNANVKKRLGMVLVFLGSLGSLSPMAYSAPAADPTACVGEIQSVCRGLEDHLETCLHDRQASLSQTCRDQLDSAVSLSANGAGPAPCLNDIQNACGSLGEREMAQCIASKKQTFSKACQDFLTNVQTTAKQSTATPE